MGKSKSSLSKAHSYAEIGEFWDTHDLTEYWDQTKPAEFEVDICSEVTHYALDNTLAAEVRTGGAAGRCPRNVAQPMGAGKIAPAGDAPLARGQGQERSK